jgi:hypothetical protein
MIPCVISSTTSIATSSSMAIVTAPRGERCSMNGRGLAAEARKSSGRRCIGFLHSLGIWISCCYVPQCSVAAVYCSNRRAGRIHAREFALRRVSHTRNSSGVTRTRCTVRGTRRASLLRAGVNFWYVAQSGETSCGRSRGLHQRNGSGCALRRLSRQIWWLDGLINIRCGARRYRRRLDVLGRRA